ncbi:MAG TPA: MFS transporter [Ktedonosporobacter sp.]|nr:MFS transporter [Ktedonosporobacter sp.]
MSYLRPGLLIPNLSKPTFRPKSPSSVKARAFAACFTAMMVAVHYTNYSPLIVTIRSELHVTSGQVGLFSTLLFLGLAITYIPAGILADRLGGQRVLLGSCILLSIGGILLPLFANLPWLLFCRILVGLGSGGAFVAGAGVAAGLGKHASLGQGLYGGATQVGSGMGLLVTPFLLSLLGWRGSFLFWGLLSTITIVLWLFINDGQEGHKPTQVDLKAAVRSPSVWTLGLSHLGTFGLGNAIAAWITIYLVDQYHLSLTLAATFGSFSILSGMFFRPIGGILLARKTIGAIPLLRLGTIMGTIGVGLLAIPLHFPPFAVIGMSLIAIGSTTPYTSVFNSAANLRSVGKGVAQGFVSLISSPTVIIGPPLIGFLLDRTGTFTFAFGSIMLFGFVAITSSFLAGPAVKREAST